MIKMLLAGLLGLFAVNAEAAGFQLAVDTQDVNIINEGGSITVTSTDTVVSNGAGAAAVNIQDGGNVLSIDDDGSSITVDAVNLDVRDLSGSQDSVNLNDGTDSLDINADGSIDVNAELDLSGGALAVTSTNTVIQDGGNVISVDDAGSSLTVDAVNLDVRDLSDATDSVAIGDGTDNLAVNADGSLNITDNGGSLTVDALNLDVRDLAQATDSVAIGDGTDTVAVNADGSLNVIQANIPNLSGKSHVMVSSDAMTAASTLTLTGVGKDVTVMAFKGECTFTMPAGNQMVVAKNMGETFDMGYLITNPAVTLDALDAGATCKARITGAN